MADALAAELHRFAERLHTLEAERADTTEKSAKDEAIAKAEKGAEALSDLAKAIVNWNGPKAEKGKDGKQTIPETRSALQDAIAEIVNLLVHPNDGMTKRVEKSCQSNVQSAEVRTPEQEGSRQKLQATRQAIEEKIREAQDMIINFRCNIKTASTAAKGMEKYKPDSWASGKVLAFLVASGTGAGLWFGSIHYPPLAFGAIGCNFVQAWYIIDDFIKTRKLKKNVADVEANGTDKAYSMGMILGLEDQTRDIEIARLKVIVLSTAVKRYFEVLERYCEKA